jgi:hypothetical protein
MGLILSVESGGGFREPGCWSEIRIENGTTSVILGDGTSVPVIECGRYFQTVQRVEAWMKTTLFA